MQAIEMVSRLSMSTSTTERTNGSNNQSAQFSLLTARPNDGRRECVPRQPVVLDAFDKIILNYPEQTSNPM